MISNLRSVKKCSHVLTKSSKSDYSFEISTKYKDTFIGKWSLFWKNLYLDYKEVAVETVAKARKQPGKALSVLAGLAGIAYCGRLNPDEQSYRDAVLECSHELALVGAQIRNPSACGHLRRVAESFDKGEVRRLSLGLLSLVWADVRNADLGLYSARCDYLEPRPGDWPGLVLDVGFLGRWWLLSRAMRDFDVDPSEFGEPVCS